MGAILICVSVCVSEYLCEKEAKLMDKAGQKLDIEQSGAVCALTPPKKIKKLPQLSEKWLGVDQKV